MPVEMRNSQRKVVVNIRQFKKNAELLLRAVGRPESSLSILLTDDEGIAGLHEEWMGDSSPTDVLSFPQKGKGEPRIGKGISAGRKQPPDVLGDVVISAETAVRRQPRVPVKEMECYLVHGLLHLIGHDHAKKTERLRMNREASRLRALIQKRGS